MFEKEEGGGGQSNVLGIDMVDRGKVSDRTMGQQLTGLSYNSLPS
jgi:hypothetical protein